MVFKSTASNTHFQSNRSRRLSSRIESPELPTLPILSKASVICRSTIIPIINLRMLLGVAPKTADGETRTIVVNVGQRTIGCTVDSVSQVIRISAADVQPTPSTITADGDNYISGFAKVQEALVILLDVDQLLDTGRFGQG